MHGTQRYPGYSQLKPTYDIPELGATALWGNKPLLIPVSSNTVVFPLLLRAGWHLHMVKSFLDAGSFVPCFNGDGIFLTGVGIRHTVAPQAVVLSKINHVKPI